MKFATPSLKHLSKEDFLNVYEPAEDTFLMLDALEMDIRPDDKGFASVLEIGCGTGVSLCQMAHILKGKTVLLTGTDINPLALKATKGTITENLGSTCNLELIQMNLVNGFRTYNNAAAAKYDYIIFNPPYVPTSTPNPSSAIESTWAGGPKGRFWIDLLLPSIPALLRDDCSAFYMIALQNGNDVNDILNVATTTLSLRHNIVIKRRCGIEHLCVIKFTL